MYFPLRDLQTSETNQTSQTSQASRTKELFRDALGTKGSFEFYGDCIGLSPQIFGKVGPYVQSDM